MESNDGPQVAIRLVGNEQMIYLQRDAVGHILLVAVPTILGADRQSPFIGRRGPLPDGLSHVAASWDGKGDYRLFVNGRAAQNVFDATWQMHKVGTSSIWCEEESPASGVFLIV